MARPHVEFIFSQRLPWESTDRTAWGPSIEWKVLSEDAGTGEWSAIVKFVRAYRGEFAIDQEQELYVLDGSLSIQHRLAGRDCYARVAAGASTHWEVDAGTVLILFTNVPPRDESPLVNLVLTDCVATHWDRSGVPAELEYMGIGRKALYVDPSTGFHRTWLLTTAPQIFPSETQLARETHACAEEVFMLAGDITGPQGAMRPGAYFWRPRDTFHGPFGSRDGGLALCRFRDGVQSTIFHDETLPFAFDAPYRPDLPKHLAHLADGAPSNGARY